MGGTDLRLFVCPVDGCDWSYLEPRRADVGPETLAGVFGPGVMVAVAEAQRMRNTEEAIAAHLSRHSTLEWLKTVMRLKALEEDTVKVRMEQKSC